MQEKTPVCENKRTTRKEKGGKLCTTMNNECDKDRDFPPQGSPTRPDTTFERLNDLMCMFLDCACKHVNLWYFMVLILKLKIIKSLYERQSLVADLKKTEICNRKKNVTKSWTSLTFRNSVNMNSNTENDLSPAHYQSILSSVLPIYLPAHELIYCCCWKKGKTFSSSATFLKHRCICDSSLSVECVAGQLYNKINMLGENHCCCHSCWGLFQKAGFQKSHFKPKLRVSELKCQSLQT